MDNLGPFFTTKDAEFDDGNSDDEDNVDGEDEDGGMVSDNGGSREIQDSITEGGCETGKLPKSKGTYYDPLANVSKTYSHAQHGFNNRSTCQIGCTNTLAM